MKKNIDFDTVAKYYDTYVQFDDDLEFWKNEIGTPEGYVLEIMCGSGRISIPLINQGVKFYGLDYSKGLLRELNRKMKKYKLHAKIIHADARQFNIRKKFEYIFIGCHSLSEILENKDKLLLLESVKKHLSDDGKFIFSLHNPEYKIKQLETNAVYSDEFDYKQNGSKLKFTFKLITLDKKSNIVQATQEYLATDINGKKIENFSMDIAYHLINKNEIESLLEAAGFEVNQIYGDYDGNSYRANSPFMIYRCQRKTIS